MKKLLLLVAGLLVILSAADTGGQPRPNTTTDEKPSYYLLKPARVFDGLQMHDGWLVLTAGNKIAAAGPAEKIQIPKKGVRVMDLPNMTLLPGLIDAHTHLLLHPYDEASWDDQVLKEPLALRVCRATNHAKATLNAGFTTIRDLGTEGAGYADVGIKQAIDQGIIPGPRVLASTSSRWKTIQH